MMAKICREAEADINYSELYPTLRRQIRLPISVSEAIASSAGIYNINLSNLLLLLLLLNVYCAVASYIYFESS